MRFFLGSLLLAVLAFVARGAAPGAPATNAAPRGPRTNAVARHEAWAGPAWAGFDLTWTEGRGTEAFGPIWGTSESDGERAWRLSPFFASVKEPALEKEEWNLFYPAVGYRRYGTEWKLHVLQFLEFSGGDTVDAERKERTTLFPFYFRQRSTNPTNDYLAVLPFYGHVRNRLFRSEVKFVLAPLYVQTRKKDWVTDNYLVPFFHVRRGPNVDGWQFWPVIGAEHRRISWQTNSLDELEVVPGHDKRFLFWPFGFSERLEVGGANPTTNLFVFPLYLHTRSVEQDHDWWFFFSHRTNRAAKFEEWSYPWPFLGHARGPGKTARRVWPLWGKAHGGGLTSDFVAWPFYVHKRLQSDPLDRERFRFLYFGYDDLRQTDTTTGRSFRRRDLWPLFTWRHELDGRERLQVLAPAEPLFPANPHVERVYSPVWSLWRSESNPALRRTSQSLLWNLWRRETTAAGSRSAALFGAVAVERDARGRHWSFLWTGRRAAGDAAPSKPVAAAAAAPAASGAHRGPELRPGAARGPAMLGDAR